MASEFEEYYQDIDEQLQDAEAFLPQIVPLKGEKRVLAIGQLKNRMEMIKNHIGLAENEYNCIRDKMVQNQLKPKMDELLHRQEEINAELERIEKPPKRLITDQDAEDVDMYEQQQDGEGQQKVRMNDMEKVRFASVLYDDAKIHLVDADRNLDEITVINDDITAQLEKDTHKLQRVNDDLIGIRAENQIAKRQLRQLAQRATSNKCYIAIFFVVVLVILGLTIADIAKSVGK